MAGTNREVEVKLPFPSPDAAAEKLRRLGAVLVRERVFEDNAVFDRADGELRRTERVLRLRRAGGEVRLTVKGPPAAGTRHKDRAEYEVAVSSAETAEGLLELLGYRAGWRYQKYRTAYRLGAVEALLDETPLGCFVELEGEPDAIDAAAEALGFSPDSYVRASYRELAEARAAAEGREVGPLLVDRP